MREPILAQRSIPSGRRYRLTMKVVGGLQYLKGNRLPYFSLTVDIHRKGFPNQCQSGGCDHETILKYYPEYADLAALHLSDINGVPMYAEANGWYWMAGAVDGNFGERYHGGNSKQNFPKPPNAPRRGAWDTTDYREPTFEESLETFSRYARVSIEIARALRSDLLATDTPRAAFAAWIEAQKPRWAAEAKACIERHGLKVFGDDWGGRAQ